MGWGPGLGDTQDRRSVRFRLSLLRASNSPAGRNVGLILPRDRTRLNPDAVKQLLNLLEDRRLLLDETGDLLDGVHDGGVVTPAELLGDLGVVVVGQLPEDVHADLAGLDQRPPPALADELVDR